MSFESPELGRVMAYVRRLGEYASGQEIVVSGSYIEPQCDRLDVVAKQVVQATGRGYGLDPGVGPMVVVPV